MSRGIETNSYDTIHAQYSAAVEWMKSLDVDLGRSRLSHYDRVFGYWNTARLTASAEEGQAIFPDFVSSASEISAFVNIFEAFRATPRTQLTSIAAKLRKAVRGPTHASDETQRTTEARNVFFEAVVAARSHRPSAGIEAILDAESDTGIRLQKKQIWIECKRVMTIGKIYDNARAASKQLESRLEKMVGANHRAIVAIDVSKIFNQGDKILVRDSGAELIASLQSMMDRFIREHASKWQRLYERRSAKIIGTIIHFSTMCSIEDRNILVHASEWGVNPRQSRISSSDIALLRELARGLE